MGHNTINQSPIYRLLDNSQWLDNFFEKGEIMLSCFSKFKKYPNEIQGDKQEGNALAWFEDLTGDTIGFKYESGLNSFVMSTTCSPTEKIKTDFNAVGAIKINDSARFVNEINRTLAVCTGTLEGFCQYSNSRVFQLKDNTLLASLWKGIKSVNDPLFNLELQRQTAENELFLKHARYEYQNEYRAFWFMEEKVSESTVITCPACVKYCERINFSTP